MVNNIFSLSDYMFSDETYVNMPNMYIFGKVIVSRTNYIYILLNLLSSLCHVAMPM